jgi:tRNA-2-methylthio-N6-dimethylallyladenosine synthase
MNRTYAREWYINRIDRIREILGEDCGISHDMISGFCSETEEEHRDTLSLMDYVKYDFGYMFSYSERPGTLAAKKYEDDIPADVKLRRLQEIIAKQQVHSLIKNKKLIGTVQRVLAEGFSKKSDNDLQGRTDQNKVVVFPKENYKAGQYINVLINDCTTATLLGTAVESEV